MRISGARALAWSRYGVFSEAEWEHLPLETRVENINLAWSQLRVLRKLGFRLVRSSRVERLKSELGERKA